MRLRLLDDNHAIPSWWENCIREISDRYVARSTLAQGDQWEIYRAESVAEWGAIAYRDPVDHYEYLEFENDEDLTLFLLRWS